ncbi:MAG: adenylosuccinate lyase [Proteobacteria bacterium]|nr:adenylosuccinate lyase [Pseudomonadota bacterium]
MPLSQLKSISPLEGRYHSKVSVLSDFFSEYALIKYRVLVELKWFEALCAEPKISEVPNLSPITKKEIAKILTNFSTNDAKQIKKIELETNHDVKAVEYWLKRKFKNIPTLRKCAHYIHFACTSEDINNIAHALMLKDSRDKVLLPFIESLIEQLSMMAKKYSSLPMISRTHGQAASPTTLGKEIANFTYRLRTNAETIRGIKLTAKANGAVGNFNAHITAYPKVNWQKLSKSFVTNLDLSPISYTTQIEPHDNMAQLFDAYKRFNSVLLDLNHDFWAYISMGYFRQKIRAGEVGSSTMPHKVNPIDFENSEGNLGLANSLLAHLSQKLLISRLQRDLSDSTVIRNNGVALGYSFIAYQATAKGLKKLAANVKVIKKDLEHRWEILAEPIQTVMKRYGIQDSYEALKELTRGDPSISRERMAEYINALPIPEEEKRKLLALTPEKYLGLSEKLAKSI